MRLLRRAARVLSLIVAGLIASSSSFSGPTGPTPVWLSDGSDVVRQLNPETHTVLRSLALPDGASARLYGIIETAKANGHEPYAYLRRILRDLPAAKTVADIEALMPWNLEPGALVTESLN